MCAALPIMKYQGAFKLGKKIFLESIEHLNCAAIPLIWLCSTYHVQSRQKINGPVVNKHYKNGIISEWIISLKCCYSLD